MDVAKQSLAYYSIHIDYTKDVEGHYVIVTDVILRGLPYFLELVPISTYLKFGPKGWALIQRRVPNRGTLIKFLFQGSVILVWPVLPWSNNMYNTCKLVIYTGD